MNFCTLLRANSRIRKRVGQAIRLVLLATTLTGCATRDVAIEERHFFSVSTRGFEQDTSVLPTQLFIRPDAPRLANYDRFIVDPVSIDYNDPDIAELNVKDIRRIQNYFFDAMVEALESGGYTIATRSEENTLRMSFLITNLSAPDTYEDTGDDVIPFVLDVGKITVEAVFRDAVSDQVNFVALARAEGSYLLNPTPWSTWQDVEETIDAWAAEIVEAIDNSEPI